MNINNFLNLVCDEIKYKPIRNEIAEELKGHINEVKQEYIDKGLESNQAESKAVEQMGNPKEIGLKLNRIHKPRLDWKLLIIMIIMLGFSLLVAFTRAKSHILQNNQMGILTKYIFFMIIGLILSIICYFFDYRKLLKHSNKLFIIASLLIVWSLHSSVYLRGIAHLRIGAYTFSPNIIAIPMYIIAFVGFLENIKKESKVKIKYLEEKNININIIKIIISCAFSLYLLAIIPSMVSAFLVGITYLSISILKARKESKNYKKNIGLLLGMPLILILLIVITAPMGMFRFNRITASFNPESDPNGAGWIGINQKLIINSAKLIGEAEDLSNALEIFDEGTNYAFVSILAHYGWGISGLLILIIVLLNIKLIINAITINDKYGKNLIIGISIMFILQSICSLLMNLNLGVQADFNIPFVSYGGANLIINMCCIGLVFSVYRRKDIIIKIDKAKLVED